MEDSRILLVVDLQKQFKDEHGKYEECLKFINRHARDYDRVFATLFANKPDRNPNYVEKLYWGGCRDVDWETDLEFAAITQFVLVEKSGYGLPGDPLTIFCSSGQGNYEIDVIGCDTDACVLAVCFQLWDAGLNFNVLWDYVYTTGAIDEKSLRKLYKRNFGV